MTLETALYNAKTYNTGGRENGAPRTGDCRLNIKFSPELSRRSQFSPLVGRRVLRAALPQGMWII